MTRLQSKIIILIVFLFNTYYSQQNIFYEITGNKVIDDKALLNILIDFNAPQEYEKAKKIISENIQRKYSDEGYFNAKVGYELNQVDSLKYQMRIFIRENSPTVIKNIEFTSGDSSIGNIDSNAFRFLIGKIFNRIEIEKAIYELLKNREQSGYPFASVEINNFYIYTDSSDGQSYCNLDLDIHQNEKSLIDKIKIEGNTKTKEYVIKRNIRINEGDEFNSNKINAIPEILNRMKYFDAVKPAQYYFDIEKKGVLKIEVKERTTNNFDGIIGYVPSGNKKEKGYFTGFLNLGFRNLFGTERMFLFKWQKDGRLSQELELNYIEPWVFDYPISVSLFLWQRKQDSSYVQRKYEVKMNFLANEEISFGLLLGYESTIPSSELTKTNVLNSNSSIMGIIFSYDTRDDILSPHKGLLFNTTYKYQNKKIHTGLENFSTKAKSNSYLQRIEFNTAYFLSPFNRQVIALSLHARELKGSLIEISDLYKLGGTFSLRGYLENQFLGNRLLWSNIEYRYLIERRSYVYVFFDEGYFFMQKEFLNRNHKLSGFRSGYGLGLNIETGIGILGVSFALSKGDTFTEGKIHFGIINEF